MTNRVAMKAPRTKKSQNSQIHCLQEARAFSQKLPETTETALFAYAPDTLDEGQKHQLEELYRQDDGYRRIVDRMRKDRKWLAPQYGLQ